MPCFEGIIEENLKLHSGQYRQFSLLEQAILAAAIPGSKSKDQKGPIISFMLPCKLNPFSNTVIRHIPPIPKGLQKLQRGPIAPQSRRRHQLQEQVLNSILFLLVGVGLCPEDEEREEDIVREDVDWSCSDEVDFGGEVGDGCCDCFGG